MKRYAFPIFCIALVLGTMTPCRATEGERSVDIGGCRLHMLVQGHDQPVVVLESGGGDTINPWQKVQPEVAKFACVIAYDRAGLGMFDPAVTEPRSSARIARELRTALHKADLPPPYILVGHSIGGFHVRPFSHQFPKEVAGSEISCELAGSRQSVKLALQVESALLPLSHDHRQRPLLLAHDPPTLHFTSAALDRQTQTTPLLRGHGANRDRR